MFLQQPPFTAFLLSTPHDTVHFESDIISFELFGFNHYFISNIKWFCLLTCSMLPIHRYLYKCMFHKSF